MTQIAGVIASMLAGLNAEPAAIQPFSASQSPVAAYSLRRINPSYAGACLQVRDSGNTLRTLSFGADGSYDAPAATWSTYGDGVTFTVATWYDQTANGRNLTSTARPKLIFPNAPANYQNAYIDYDQKVMNMVTSATFLDIGGTANLSILAVAGTFGWSSAGTHARNPAVFTAGINGPLVGCGTTAAGALVYGAFGANGETIAYSGEGALLLEDGAPTNTRIRQIWFNQAGANMSGGSGGALTFSGRPHGVAASAANRLVLGNHGGLQQSHNGPVYELVIYQSAAAMTDNEVRAVARGQLERWTVASKAVAPERYLSLFSGQSLAQYYDTVASFSGGGTDSAQWALSRVYVPALRTRLAFDGNPQRRLVALANTTAIGNSSVLRRDGGSQTPDAGGGTSWAAWDGATDSKRFWWDQHNNIPGPVYQLWRQSALQPGARYRNTVIMWSQGEREAAYIAATGEETGLGVSYANWQTYTKSVWAQMRADIGADVPILIQPLGRQTGCDAQQTEMRRRQNLLAQEVAGVTISADTYHLTRQDSVHFAAGPADPDGFDRGAQQLARSMAARMGASGQQWECPFIASAAVSGSNVDLTIAWPADGGGNTIATIDGNTSGFVGFSVSDGSGARTVSSVTRIANNVLRVAVSGAALAGSVTLRYDPFPSALDRLKMPVDNNSLPMPLRPGVITV